MANGKAIENKITTLYFQVRGSSFPNWTDASSSSVFSFISYIRQSVNVNWGDGNLDSYELTPGAGYYQAGWTQDGLPNTRIGASNVRPSHTYTDGNSGVRIISFSFEQISELSSFWSYNILFEGAFPSGISESKKLTQIILNNPKGLTSFPYSLSNNKFLRIMSLSNISPSKSNKIPDSFFELDLRELNISSSFNLSDKIASNLFKLNQFNSLEKLLAESCNIYEFDSTWGELITLKELRLVGNNFSNFPIEIEGFVNLELLYINVTGTGNSFIDFSNLSKLRAMNIYGNFILSEITTKWTGLVSLTSIGVLQALLSTNQYDLFIDVFYELCTTNGAITQSAGNFGGIYPNRFRNISYGFSSYRFTGAKVAPTGYVQGVSNGTPNTQGQKAYVLQNQYNHTITHGTPL